MEPPLTDTTRGLITHLAGRRSLGGCNPLVHHLSNNPQQSSPSTTDHATVTWPMVPATSKVPDVHAEGFLGLPREEGRGSSSGAAVVVAAAEDPWLTMEELLVRLRRNCFQVSPSTASVCKRMGDYMDLVRSGEIW